MAYWARSDLNCVDNFDIFLVDKYNWLGQLILWNWQHPKRVVWTIANSPQHTSCSKRSDRQKTPKINFLRNSSKCTEPEIDGLGSSSKVTHVSVTSLDTHIFCTCSHSKPMILLARAEYDMFSELPFLQPWMVWIASQHTPFETRCHMRTLNIAIQSSWNLNITPIFNVECGFPYINIHTCPAISSGPVCVVCWGMTFFESIFNIDKICNTPIRTTISAIGIPFPSSCTGRSLIASTIWDSDTHKEIQNEPIDRSLKKLGVERVCFECSTEHRRTILSSHSTDNTLPEKC